MLIDSRFTAENTSITMAPAKIKPWNPTLLRIKKLSYFQMEDLHIQTTNISIGIGYIGTHHGIGISARTCIDSFHAPGMY